MTAAGRDWTPHHFAGLLVMGPARPPMTERLLFPHGRADGDGYTERHHMVGWFLTQQSLGSGAYSRARPCTSARLTYSRLLSGHGLIWIGESLGAPAGAVAAAVAEEHDRDRPAAARCAAIRRALPWALVAELAAAREEERGAATAAAAADFMFRKWHP